MTPLSSNQVIPENIGSITQAGEQPLLSPAPLASPALQLGITTDSVIPVIPAAGTPPSELVNPVNSGNLAGLPPSEPEGITDGTISKTFKLPILVMRSIERAVEELNKVTPGNTTHNYGVNLLSRHKELLDLSATYNGLQEKVEESNRMVLLLQQENFRKAEQIRDLTTQLAQAALSSGTPPPSKPQEPVIPPADDTWRIRCQELQTELKSALESLELEKDSARPLYSFFKDVLPVALELLCQEAAAQSWKKPEYYQQYFQEVLAPHLETTNHA